MKSNRLMLIIISSLILMASAFTGGCGDDDDDNASEDSADDDIDDDTNNDPDDDVNDDADDDVDDDADDDVDDDADDDVDDDFDDLYVAPWPQTNVEIQDYDETPGAGSSRLKAEDYDQFHLDWHQPYYGSTVGQIIFTDENRTEVANYSDYGDSSIWTGTYLVSQSMRYHVTGDPVAKANAIRAATSLDRHLHVTGRTGFIARYVAPQDDHIYGGDAWCDGQDSCHHYEDGPYAGDWWAGDTSRDQYTGWFFGMATAFDLVDDEDMRAMIASNVAEVLDELLATNWWIIEVDGEPTAAAPNVLPTQQLTWSLIGYHLTGDERYKGIVQNWIADSNRTYLRLMNITLTNKYTQYYGNNLGHENMYTLLRLGKAYLSPDDYAYISELFDEQTHSFTRLSHNAFFNAVFMSQGMYEPTGDDPFLEQLEQDIGEFRDAPNWVYFVDPPDGVIDPISIFLSDLMIQYPFLAELLGNVEPQSQDAHPVLEQCSTDFLWQRNPFRYEPCGSDSPHITRPGVDYLTAYWMSAYHKFIDKSF
jgi:hypothetical protein